MIGAVYKQGQGYWTRTMSAIAATLVVLLGAVWLWEVMAGVRIGGLEPVYVQAASVVVLFAVFGLLGYWLIGVKPESVDFMIATEAEMKKVNWSSRREILGSTWLVILLTAFLAVLCFLLDRMFFLFFLWIDVLESTTT